MDYPNLRELRRQNPKAANEMVASIARGIHAGNGGMIPQRAAEKAVETTEEILKLMAPAQAGTIGRAAGYLSTNDGDDVDGDDN